MAENDDIDLTCYETSEFLYDSALDVWEPQIVNGIDVTCYESRDFIRVREVVNDVDAIEVVQEDVLEPQIVNGIDVTCYESRDFLRVRDRDAPEVREVVNDVDTIEVVQEDVLEPQIVNGIDVACYESREFLRVRIEDAPEVRDAVSDVDAKDASVDKNLNYDHIDTVSLHGVVKLSDLIVKAECVKIDFDQIYENEKTVGVVVKDGYQLSVETGPKKRVRLTCVKSIMEDSSKLGKSPLVTWLAVHYFDRVLSFSDDILPEWPAACIVIASNAVEDDGVNRESLHKRLGEREFDQVLKMLDVTPPLTPFTFLGYYCEKAGISLGMALENLPSILKTVTDTQFLGLKAWEICLAFVLSVAFEEESGCWNDTRDDLFYKADKKKVKDCFIHLKLAD